MAAEIVRLVWCDICLAGEGSPKVPAGDETAIVIGNAATVLALCEPHAMEILAPLTSVLHLGDTKHEALQRLSAKPAKAPEAAAPPRTRVAVAPPTGEHRCPAEDCGYTGGTKDALSTHVRGVHHTTLSALLGIDWPKTQPLPCDLCDLSPTGPASALVHLIKTHGMPEGPAREHRDAIIRRAKNSDLTRGQLALPGGP